MSAAADPDVDNLEGAANTQKKGQGELRSRRGQAGAYSKWECP